jgi:proteasome lid subunit RPN8/RPN11
MNEDSGIAPGTATDQGLIPGGDDSMHGPPGSLAISAADWHSVLDHLRAALPNESCALLACPESDGPDVLVTRVYPGTNILASPTRFEMDPGEIIAAFVSMREAGLRLAAIAHSHPSDPPTLSPVDLREANYPEAALVIVSFQGPAPEAAAWRLDSGNRSRPQQIPLRIAGP